MRRAASSIVLGLVLLAPALPASAAASHKKTSARCPPTRARAIVADTQAEVYLLPEHFGGRGGVEPSEIFGCTFKNKRAYVLGEPVSVASSGTAGISLETLDGPTVAYEAGSGGPTGAEWRVVVRDLSNGKVIDDLPTGTPAHPQLPRTEGGLTVRDVGIGPATSIVVKSDGGVAWIVSAPKEDGYYQVHAVDKTGSRVLASGPEIDPTSLALAGSTLYWSEAGRPMSATLN